MSAKADHRPILEGFFKEVWNNQDDSAVERYVSPDLVEHGLTELAPISMNLEDFLLFRASILESFPDIHFELEEVLSEGPFCAVRYSITGTHLGDGLGFPATGKEISIAALGTGRIEDGKLIEAWNCLDKLGMLRQLGVV